MGADLRTVLRWALRVSGVAGLVLSLATLPTIWAIVTGQVAAGFSYESVLPSWAQWHTISGVGIGLVFMGAICALLMVAGHWSARTLAVIAVAWTVYSKAAFNSGGYWNLWMANTGDATPYSIAVALTGVLIVAVSVVALVAAWRLRSTVGHQPHEAVPTGGHTAGIKSG